VVRKQGQRGQRGETPAATQAKREHAHERTAADAEDFSRLSHNNDSIDDTLADRHVLMSTQLLADQET
jgi:hypothetical protein